MTDFAKARKRMVQRQVADRGVSDAAVLKTMRQVPREKFLPPGMAEFAYNDAPLPIEEGQTISQPYIVALMLEAAAIRPGDKLLEIGTGSGYAAAVAAEIGAEVYSIERHEKLAEAARRRLDKLGYGVEVRVGDGTLGWPEAAPFDAVMVTAGGPSVPPALKQQLAIGGRLVMPVGESARLQQLLRLTRRSETQYEQEDLGAVMFVPLIGAQGWSENERHPGRDTPGPPPTIPALIREAAELLPDPSDPAFGEAFDRFADRRVVLLGEASHGTSEFYRARAAITRRLVERHGFSIVAVEADWPDAAMIDTYVRHRPLQHGAEPPFRRFPTWMWRNTDVEAFVEWLRAHNERLPADERAGFYGLDLYNLSGSIAAVVGYLDSIDPEAAAVARERYGCLTPWQKDPAVYGRVVLQGRYQQCEDAVVAQLQDMLKNQLDYAEQGGHSFLDAAQNARLVASAERYYRVMYYGSAESWNLRDTHMFETLAHILAAGGADDKAVVWAHNSHVGNAAATEMGKVREEINIGQLCREHFGKDAAMIGFGTHTGTVAAVTDWGDPMEIKRVRPSMEGSYERLCHEAGLAKFLLDLAENRNEVLRKRLMEPRLERFIGVIYRPETELLSHYADATLPEQFDAWVWFDETSAVTPLPTAERKTGVPDTYPFGL